MPSFSAPDYVHLKQQNSNSTLTSNISETASQHGHHGQDSTNGPLQEGPLDDRVYLADDSVVVGDPIIVNFRDRKPWGACPCNERIKLKKVLLASLLAFLIGFLCIALILAMMHNDKKGKYCTYVITCIHTYVVSNSGARDLHVPYCVARGDVARFASNLISSAI